MNDHIYPLMDSEAEEIASFSGRQLTDINIDALGQLQGDDLRISRETLVKQATIARASGFTQLAGNLERAAELSAVPDEELLAMYEMLRPRRATYQALTRLAQRLETSFHAPATAELVREAAEVYRQRDMLLSNKA